MPLPTVITDLSPVIASNSPAGSDSPTQGDDFLRAHAAFIRQNYDANNTLRTDLANTASATLGAALVGYNKSLGYAYGTVGEKLKRRVNVRDYATGGLGTLASPWTGWDTAITWAQRTAYYFDDGYFAYATSPNFALFKLQLHGTGNTVLLHTGTGYALVFDAGTVDEVYSVGVFGDLRVEGNASSTGGVYIRGVHHSRFDISTRNVPGTCFTVLYGVCNDYWFKHTALFEGQTIVPNIGLFVDERNPGERSTASNFYRPIFENIAVRGIQLEGCANCVFLAGTSEVVVRGISLAADTQGNTFIGLDLELNTNIDIACSGTFNNFINIISTNTCQIGGNNNLITGGTYNEIIEFGTDNTYDNVGYANSAGVFTDSGTRTTKRNVKNQTSGLTDPDKHPHALILGVSGTAITRYLSATASLTFPAPGAVPGNLADQTITVTGAAVGDTVMLGLPSGPGGAYTFYAWVSGANTVSVRAIQHFAAAAGIAAATYRVSVIKH